MNVRKVNSVIVTPELHDFIPKFIAVYTDIIPNVKEILFKDLDTILFNPTTLEQIYGRSFFGIKLNESATILTLVYRNPITSDTTDEYLYTYIYKLDDNPSIKAGVTDRYIQKCNANWIKVLNDVSAAVNRFLESHPNSLSDLLKHPFIDGPSIITYLEE